MGHPRCRPQHIAADDHVRTDGLHFVTNLRGAALKLFLDETPRRVEPPARLNDVHYCNRIERRQITLRIIPPRLDSQLWIQKSVGYARNWRPCGRLPHTNPTRRGNFPEHSEKPRPPGLFLVRDLLE